MTPLVAYLLLFVADKVQPALERTLCGLHERQ